MNEESADTSKAEVLFLFFERDIFESCKNVYVCVLGGGKYRPAPEIT